MFPIIHTLDDILIATEGRDEILVADRGTHTVVNYLVVKPDTFPPLGSLGVDPRNGNDIAALRRECRGMIFDREGNIVRRPLHKFFNINEREETLAQNIDLSQPHEILVKEDGSSISPFYLEEQNLVYYGTRMGPTEIGDQAGNFAVNGPLAANYMTFVHDCIDFGWTPIFEWCSRSQRIVIDHPEDRLVLLAIRHINTGVYQSYRHLQIYGRKYGIPVVQPLPVDGDTTAQLVEKVRALPMAEFGEGIVLRIGQQFFKSKLDEYCLIHNAKERILEERYVVEDILNGDIDDVMATVLEDDRKNVEQYIGKFWDAVCRYGRELYNLIKLRHQQYPNRKDYALSPENKQDSKFATQAIFWFYEVDLNLTDLQAYIIAKRIRPALGTRTKFGEMKNEVLQHIRFKY